MSLRSKIKNIEFTFDGKFNALIVGGFKTILCPRQLYIQNKTILNPRPFNNIKPDILDQLECTFNNLVKS